MVEPVETRLPMVELVSDLERVWRFNTVPYGIRGSAAEH
jgi:hypothetical protein